MHACMYAWYPWKLTDHGTIHEYHSCMVCCMYFMGILRLIASWPTIAHPCSCMECYDVAACMDMHDMQQSANQPPIYR